MSIRVERVAGEIHQALARLLQTDFRDLSDGMMTVTKVRMSPDLRNGRIYVSVFGGVQGPERTIKAIAAETPHIRAALAKMVRVRFVPELRFYLDDTQTEVARVEDIFKRIGAERNTSKDATPNGEQLPETI